LVEQPIYTGKVGGSSPSSRTELSEKAKEALGGASLGLEGRSATTRGEVEEIFSRKVSVTESFIVHKKTFFMDQITIMDLKATYNKIANDWVTDHDKDTWWQEGTDIFLESLPKGSHILDVGCGGGIKSAYMQNKGYKVTGIDFSAKMIEIAKKKNSRIDFEVIDLYELESYSKMFDAIFAQAVLLHIPKTRIMEVLQKMYGKLKTKGLFYIGVKGIKNDGIDESIIKENDYGYEYERFFSFYTADEFKKYLEEIKLELIWENTSSGGSTWLQFIGRKN
jgi:SAM-dependent methyltransferase